MANSSEWSRAFWPCLLYGAIILGLSSLPGNAIPAASLWRLDKLVHTVEYAVLAGLLVRGLSMHRPTWRRGSIALVAVLLAACFGGLDETYQRFTPGRSSSGLDVLADASGAILGALAASWIGRARLPART